MEKCAIFAIIPTALVRRHQGPKQLNQALQSILPLQALLSATTPRVGFGVRPNAQMVVGDV
jgi:hypothetical protein